MNKLSDMDAAVLAERLERAAYELERIARQLHLAGADDLEEIAIDLADRVEVLDAAVNMRGLL